MAVKSKTNYSLMIAALSYDDWEDDADRLRQLATGSERVLKKHLTEAEKLLRNLDAELESIDAGSATLSGFDAIRVGCVRDLLVAFRISVRETHRLLVARNTTVRRKQKTTV